MVYAILNQKGGVAKTTTTLCLAGGLQELGKKVLIIDTDPQCNATDTYGAQTEDTYTLYDLLANNGELKGQPERSIEAVQHTESGDIIAGDPLLRAAEAEIQGAGRENRLKRALAALRTIYDVILIDTPPQAGLLQNNAMVAADACIVPVTPDRYAIAGLADLGRAIMEVQESGLNDDLTIAGLLLVRVDPRQQLSKDILQALPAMSEQLRTKCYKTTIREAVAIRKSQASKQVLFAWEKENGGPSTVGNDFRDFAKEVLKDG